MDFKCWGPLRLLQGSLGRVFEMPRLDHPTGLFAVLGKRHGLDLHQHAPPVQGWAVETRKDGCARFEILESERKSGTQT